MDATCCVCCSSAGAEGLIGHQHIANPAYGLLGVDVSADSSLSQAPSAFVR